MKIWITIAIITASLAFAVPSVTAFCNGDYGTRYPITNLDNYSNPFLVNDTYGVDLGDGPQYIWCNATSNYLCYDNSSSYACFYEDTKMPTLVDEGNGTDYGNFDDNLQMWLTFNGTGDSLDNYTITAQNSPVQASGKIGQAYDLDDADSDYFSSDLTSIGDTFSMSAWFTSDGGDQSVFGKRSGVKDEFILYMDGDPTLKILIGESDSWTSADSNIDYADSNWHHAVVVDDNSEWTLFVDGNNVSTASVNKDENAQDLEIGSRGTEESFLDGKVDNLMYWDRALTGDEVEAIYNNSHDDGYSSLGASESSGSSDYPQWSGNLTEPASPQTFPVASIEFNVTWTDAGDTIDQAWMVHNFSGTSETEYMANQSDVWSLNVTNPAAGYYEFVFHANNTAGSSNNSDTYPFTINKGTAELNLTLNGTESNHSMTYLETINVSAWTNVSGVTPTLHRNSTVVANPLVYDPAYGYYNFTSFLNNENYTATTKTFFATVAKAASGLSMTSSPSWSIAEETQVTITCSANTPLSVTLKRDGVTVSNPYIATLDYDIYSFNCTISDTYNYTPASTTNNLNVVSGGFGCTNTETFAFETNISVPAGNDTIVLDFTSLVDDYKVSSDLGDVFPDVNTTPKGWKNTTNSYFIVNTTGYGGSTVTVKFGNTAVDYSWNTTDNTTPETSFSYSNVNSYLQLTFIDERTGTVQLPPESNRTISIFCTGGISTVNASNERMIIPTFEESDEVTTKIQYSVTEIYLRNFVIDSYVMNKNVYLVDANEDQVVELLISLQDSTGDFDSALFKAKKYVEGTLRTITEHYFDAEDKVIVYLINGDKYSLYIDNGVEARSVGNLYVDSVDLTKTLSIGEVLVQNRTKGNITWSLTNTSTAIEFSYTDYSYETNSVEMYVYFSNGTTAYYTNSTNRSIVNFVYTVPNTSLRYVAEVKIHHDTFGNNTVEFMRPFFGSVNGTFSYPFFFPLAGNLPGGLSWKNFVGSIATIGSGMTFSVMAGALGGIIGVITGIVFLAFGWWEGSVVLMGIALILAVMNKLTKSKRGDLG